MGYTMYMHNMRFKLQKYDVPKMCILWNEALYLRIASPAMLEEELHR